VWSALGSADRRSLLESAGWPVPGLAAIAPDVIDRSVHGRDVFLLNLVALVLTEKREGKDLPGRQDDNLRARIWLALNEQGQINSAADGRKALSRVLQEALVHDYLTEADGHRVAAQSTLEWLGELVVTLTNAAIEMLKPEGWILEPVLTGPTLGDAGEERGFTGQADRVQMKRMHQRFEVTVDVSRTTQKTATVEVVVRDLTMNELPNLVVTLTKGKDPWAFAPLEAMPGEHSMSSGHAVFTRISEGEYQVIVTEEGRERMGVGLTIRVGTDG
jgi:hypothetical protein